LNLAAVPEWSSGVRRLRDRNPIHTGELMNTPDPIEYLEKVQKLRRRAELLAPDPKAESLRSNLAAAEQRTREFLDGGIDAGEWLEAIAMLALLIKKPPAVEA
jgi:hypothetical protein